MQSLEQLNTFVIAAESESFSAAARRLGKAQSAVSTAIINLEIDTDVALFDRSKRTPSLTPTGQALLKHARAVLRSNAEFSAVANSLASHPDTHLGIALEQGTLIKPLMGIFAELRDTFPHLEVEVFDPGAHDVAELLLNGRADICIMSEKESYPQGYYYKGIGYSARVPVCAPEHPLVNHKSVSHADLRDHHQLVLRSRFMPVDDHNSSWKSPKVWYSESPYLILDMVVTNMGWAELPWAVVCDQLASGELKQLQYDFQQSDILQGIDVVWTEQRALGQSGQWLLEKLLQLDAKAWLPSN